MKPRTSSTKLAKKTQHSSHASSPTPPSREPPQQSATLPCPPRCPTQSPSRNVKISRNDSHWNITNSTTSSLVQRQAICRRTAHTTSDSTSKKVAKYREDPSTRCQKANSQHSASSLTNSSRRDSYDPQPPLRVRRSYSSKRKVAAFDSASIIERSIASQKRVATPSPSSTTYSTVSAAPQFIQKSTFATVTTTSG